MKGKRQWCDFSPKNGKLRLRIRGSLNTPKCLEVEQELYARIRADKLPVIFDLRDVDFIASAFLRICLTVYKEVGQDRLTIVNLQPAVLTVSRSPASPTCSKECPAHDSAQASKEKASQAFHRHPRARLPAAGDHAGGQALVFHPGPIDPAL